MGCNQLYRTALTKPDPVPSPVSGATVGVKFDNDKADLSLLAYIPADALAEIGQVLDFGAKKYDTDNWLKGFAWRRLIAAAFRHLLAWSKGQDKDPETGLSHLAHAATCLIFLMTHQRRSLGTDDRIKSVA